MTNSSISYYQEWFEIALLTDLEPNKINSFYLKNKKIVVWKPHFATKYSVFIDECPYCKLPLEIGYVNDRTGSLVCGHKGCECEFDTQGICIYKSNTGNPEFINSEFIANDSHKKPLFQSATVLRTQEENGLLMGYVPGGIRTTHHRERLD